MSRFETGRKMAALRLAIVTALYAQWVAIHPGELLRGWCFVLDIFIKEELF